MRKLCDLQILVNGQETFILNEEIISRFSRRLRNIINQEKRRSGIRNSTGIIEMDDFPGGPDGFELVSRFCCNQGTITITVSNVSLLHCCAIYLGMTSDQKAVSNSCNIINLLHQTETFLEGMCYWSWNDILTCLKSCHSFFSYADSCGLLQKLMCSLLAKIYPQNSHHINLTASSTSSSSSISSDPESTSDASELIKRPSRSSSRSKFWWFDDLTILSPKMIECFVKTLGANYGTTDNNNNNLVLTRFLLHYLKTAVQSSKVNSRSSSNYTALADAAVSGVILMGETSFSCRALFWVLRVVSGFGLNRECRDGLERLIGGMLDQATLDDLLVSGHDGVGVYDVNLVLRLIRLFVHAYDDDKVVCVSLLKMKKVGRLIDKYLKEISPDQNLKVSKFLGVAESLPDLARDCFDEVYRAIDIYLESHPTLSWEERSKLCRCLNYEKLSLEACKDLAKNSRIPPRIAVQALASQHPNIPTKEFANESPISTSNTQMVLYNIGAYDAESIPEENNDMRLNLQKMQWRVVELEKVCREMRGQMSRMVKGGVVSAPAHPRALPRFC